jgi:hypothetical protein
VDEMPVELRGDLVLSPLCSFGHYPLLQDDAGTNQSEEVRCVDGPPSGLIQTPEYQAGVSPATVDGRRAAFSG